MHFKQPEILYFLFALIVPILVHLFQLRRFKTAYFTNVRFLKDISTQTRKSAVIKKWLLLATRLLLLSCIILAFAQPYFPSATAKNSQQETYIILDNSYSMQAKGNKGELLKRSVEELLSQLPENQVFSLVTATDSYWNVTTKSIRKELQRLSYSAIPFELDRAMAQINTKTSAHKKNILLITDGLNVRSKSLEKMANEQEIAVVIPKAESDKNVSIDSVVVTNQSGDFYKIEVRISQVGYTTVAVPVAIYNADKVVAKTIVTLNSSAKNTNFTLPKQPFHGSVRITDKGLEYDNSLYFTLSQPKFIKVMSIGEATKSNFLRRIYTPAEFQYQNQELAKLDYHTLEDQDVLVINELNQLPQALQTSLKAFSNQGGTLIIIPAVEPNVQANYSEFINLFGNFQLGQMQQNPQLITQIAFSHPLYKNTFEKSISNFDYPKVNKGYILNSAYPKVLSFANQQPFLVAAPTANAAVYVFSASLNSANSNFQQSPLIVPTFYSMAALQQKTTQPYYTIGEAKQLLVETELGKEELLTVKNQTAQFIPIQQVQGRKVKLDCADYPAQAGNFGVYNLTEKLENISFNYTRTESKESASTLSLDQLEQASSIESVLDAWKSNANESDLAKWFVLLALLFILLEVFIQKFVS
ncbi:MAG: hypothetical protein RL699_738 [Bacteroidota bacterium]|jgi:hypothetical protein